MYGFEINTIDDNCTELYGSVAMYTKHEHKMLQDSEVMSIIHTVQRLMECLALILSQSVCCY